MLKLISWNINGIRAVEKKGFVDLVREFDADIFAVQEVRAQKEQLSDALINIPGFTSFWFCAKKKGYSGVTVYVKKKPEKVFYGMTSPVHDAEGRTITLEYDNFYLINLYFPNAQHGLVRMDYKLSFNHILHDYATKLGAKKTVILCGDFNVAHKPIDLANPKQNEKNPGFSPQKRAWMDAFIDSGYVDTFRKFNKKPGQYSWWSYRFNARAKNIGWRIDYFCVDKKSENRVKDASILQDITGSDHCPVRLDFI